MRDSDSTAQFVSITNATSEVAADFLQQAGGELHSSYLLKGKVELFLAVAWESTFN